MQLKLLAASLFTCCFAACASAAEPEFRDLFNGRDLTGWVPMNVAPSTFTVRDGVIVSTGLPTGILRSDRHYENFILEVEWRHLKAKGNAGVFIWGDGVNAQGTPFARGVEVQVLHGWEGPNHSSHGDVFPIHGATMKPDRPHPGGWNRCLPSEHRCKELGEWNHYRITANNGVIKLAVNGKEVSGGSECSPRKGYLCLEAEGSECHFRNLRIAELPSTNPSPEETAVVDAGFRTLYTGIDLVGWKSTPKIAAAWKVQDWKLVNDGGIADSQKTLWTDRPFSDFTLQADWRWTKPAKEIAATAQAGGILLRGSEKCRLQLTSEAGGSGGLACLKADASPSKKADKEPGKWNRFLVTVKGDRITVELNQQVVVENVQLSDLPAKGPLGLTSDGAPLEFANLFVREL